MTAGASYGRFQAFTNLCLASVLSVGQEAAWTIHYRVENFQEPPYKPYGCNR